MKSPGWKKRSALLISRLPDTQKSIWQEEALQKNYLLNKGMSACVSISHLIKDQYHTSQQLITYYFLFSLVISYD